MPRRSRPASILTDQSPFIIRLMPKLGVEAKEARRRHILEAALRCFARGGYYPTTIDDIAAEAAVSKGAPYVYFEGKEALFRALCESWDCGLAEQIDGAVAGLDEGERSSPRRVLETVIGAIGEHVAAHSDLCRVLIEAQTQAAYLDGVAGVVRASQAENRARLEQLIERGKACGEWPADTESALDARLIVATIRGLMAEWHLRPGSFSWPEMARLIAHQRTCEEQR